MVLYNGNVVSILYLLLKKKLIKYFFDLNQHNLLKIFDVVYLCSSIRKK
jgi:hypothetical protein